MQDSETLGIEYSPSLADVALQSDDRDSSTYGIAAVNIYHLFTEIAERKAAVGHNRSLEVRRGLESDARPEDRDLWRQCRSRDTTSSFRS
jgi:hypothetical protein